MLSLSRLRHARSRSPTGCVQPEVLRCRLRQPPAWRARLRRRASHCTARSSGRSRLPGHGHSHGDVTHAGVTLHPASSWHKNVATGMSAIMWCVPERAPCCDVLAVA